MYLCLWVYLHINKYILSVKVSYIRENNKKYKNIENAIFFFQIIVNYRMALAIRAASFLCAAQRSMSVPDLFVLFK